MSEIFNILDFGAKPDGVTDSTAAIQAAIDAAAEIPGTVLVPPGVFLCADLQMKPGVRLEGKSAWRFRGAGQSVLQLSDPDATCLINISGAVGCTLSGLSLLGGHLGENVHGVYLHFDYFANGRQEDTPTIDDCFIEKFSGDGVHLSRVWCFSIRHSMICRNKKNGLLVWGWDGFLSDNWFTGNYQCGIACLPEAKSLTITGNRVEWNGSAGFDLRNTNAINVTGNYFDRSGRTGIDLWNDDAGQSINITVTGNIIYRNGKNKLDAEDPYECSHIRMRRCANVTVTGNSFAVGTGDRGMGEASPKYGVVYEKLRGCVIQGNVMEHGALKESFIDLGKHTGAVIVKDNAGDPVGDDPELIAHV